MGIGEWRGGIYIFCGITWAHLVDGWKVLKQEGDYVSIFSLNVSSFEGKSVFLQKSSKVIFGREAGWPKLSLFFSRLPGVAVLCN